MRVRYSILAVAAVALGAVVLAAGDEALGPALSAEVTDPVGDTLKKSAEPWQDIVRGRIVLEGGTFTFSMEMAAPLPAEPPVPEDGGWYFWDWGLEVDPELVPVGWPFPGNHAAPHEFLVILAADGEEYFAFVVDRRPLLLSQDAIVTAVPCSVDGAKINAFVDADLLDNPAEFGWRVGSQVLNGALGSEGHHRMENVPNEPVWVPWPQN